jgi:hypothetical protein
MSKKYKISLIVKCNYSPSFIFWILNKENTDGNMQAKNLAILLPTLVLKFVIIISGK